MTTVPGYPHRRRGGGRDRIVLRMPFGCVLPEAVLGIAELFALGTLDSRKLSSVVTRRRACGGLIRGGPALNNPMKEVAPACEVRDGLQGFPGMYPKSFLGVVDLMAE